MDNAIHCSNARQKCLSSSQHPSNVFPRANSNVSRSRFDGVIRLRISSWPLVRDGNISVSKTATRYHRGCFWELGAHFSASKFIGGTSGISGRAYSGISAFENWPATISSGNGIAFPTNLHTRFIDAITIEPICNSIIFDISTWIFFCFLLVLEK